MDNLLGKGRKAIDIIFDTGSFVENRIGDWTESSSLGPGAVIGTAKLKGRAVTVIANDAAAINPRFNVVYAGVIGMEEAYKMAIAVYKTIKADSEKPPDEKRPLVLIVDSPGNGPGKYEEITGMNKATGSYQLALAEARQKGHPVIAIIIGRAISGAFLCHGLQADHILALSGKFNTMIHVMPLSSIARITKMDIETLQELSKTNPVFASGAEFFYRLGGVEEILENIDDMPEAIDRHIEEIYRLNREGRSMEAGPWGRGELGAARGGRVMRKQIIELMEKEFSEIERDFLR
jgi:malonate decarboxylase gamma subunit